MNPVTAADIEPDLQFETGQRYFRKDLHQVCGGNHQPGISPIADLPAIFVFGSPADSAYGYRDEWLPNGNFLLTGVGRDGDQELKRNNKSLAKHQEDNRRVFLFENVPDTSPTVVTYVCEVACVGVRKDTLPDRNDELRDVYRFELQPVSDGTVDQEREIEAADLSELYEIAAQTVSNAEPNVSTSATTDQRARSDIVKAFALREADGICQGCGEPAPFQDSSGEPYLEVHHLKRQSDGGPDHPDNVIALCPNCHARVHYGADGDEFNAELIEQAQTRSL